MPAASIIGLVLVCGLTALLIGVRFKIQALRRTGQLLLLMGFILIILLVLALIKMQTSLAD